MDLLEKRVTTDPRSYNTPNNESCGSLIQIFLEFWHMSDATTSDTACQMVNGGSLGNGVPLVACSMEWITVYKCMEITRKNGVNHPNTTKSNITCRKGPDTQELPSEPQVFNIMACRSPKTFHQRETHMSS